jgi:hypothetical protein
MKTENNLENKAKFFTQYWERKVFMISTDALVQQNVNSFFMGKFFNKNSIVELIDILQITDEDAIEVAKLLGWIEHDEDIKIQQALDFINGGDDSCDLKSYCSVVDLLRSKCYALPYLDLSVEDLIEYGWIKLTTQERKEKTI